MKNTTLCYIEHDGAYLMMHRVKKVNDENKDKWIGIGGHVEPYESPHDCVLREIREETGLTVLPEDCAYRGVISFCSPNFETEYMHLFRTERFSGTMRTDCEEGVLEWIPRDRLMALPMWEGDRIFLDLLNEPTPFFSLKLCYDAEGNLLSHDLRFTGAEKRPLLISACLLGLPCRYDGASKPVSDGVLRVLRERYTLVPVCPEQLGGLATPRVPAEVRPDGSVRTREGVDVTDAYRRGASAALAIARAAGADAAMLKARSPSCGSGVIYDGSFTGTLRAGFGVTAEMLAANGIRVVSEESVPSLIG